MKKSRYFHYWSFCVLIAFSGRAMATHAQSAIQNRFDAARAGYAISALGEPLLAVDQLARFYEARDFRPAWVKHPQAISQLIRAIESAETQGLNPADYHLHLLGSMGHPSADGDTDIIDRDLLLSDAFFTLGAHLAAGKVDPRSIDQSWRGQAMPPDLVPSLERALSTSSVTEELRRLAPDSPGYLRLLALRTHWARLARTDWKLIPKDLVLRPGSNNPWISIIRRRLANYGLPDDAPGSSPSEYDEGLRASVMEFQRSQGLKSDGIIGPRTLSFMNRTPTERLNQIDANLERWRWLPRELGNRYIMVNIAGFNLQLIQDGKVVLAKRVVVGRSYRRTPLFGSRILYVVLNPSWVVPRKLAIEDKLPEILHDPGFLDRLGFHVYEGWGPDRQEVNAATIDWHQLNADHFPYRLVQAPGPQNALGQIKFVFPNGYDVYLHDTPSRELFAHQSRSFSSGCIRLEDPLELARILLASPNGAVPDLETLLAERKTRTVWLPHPIPIYITYWTVWVEPDGRSEWRPDIYHRDGRVITALHAPAKPWINSQRHTP